MYSCLLFLLRWCLVLISLPLKCTCYITTCRSSPLYACSLAGLIPLCHGVTVHISWRSYFTTSFFLDQVARLASSFIYLLYVCSLPFCFQMCHFGLYVSEVPYHLLLHIAQGCIVLVWYSASSIFVQQAVLWGRHPQLLGVYSSWCQTLHYYMR